MNLKKIICLIFCVATVAGAKAQYGPMLTLKEAVEIALKNNYNIKLSQNNATIAGNNVTLGNAGFLPLVTGGGALNASNQKIKQTRSDGTVNNLTANNNNNNYGVNLNWAIFDGFNMFANYDILKEQDKLGAIRLQDTIQSTVANVINTYYNLINQTEQIKALRGAIEISRTQLRYSNDKFTVGRVSKLDVYNAQVNLNTDTANLITQQQQYRQTKIQMNQLLVRNLQTDFVVGDTIAVNNMLILGDIITKAQAQNPNILSAQINKRLAEISLRQVKSTRYPVIGVTSGYTFSNSKTPAGFTLSQNAHGFAYGLTASVNIFDGLNQWRRERNAKLQIANADLSQKQVMLDVEAQISNFYVAYISGLDLIKIGQSSVELAKKNLDISLEKYKIGNITQLEIREAQRNYLDAQSKFFSAQYQAKMAEVTLQQITNSINIQ
ncbi:MULTISPECIES: TolC family protein [unclassified Mucilaginibacter]|uniref:TolC family protein n=1 Tax=unclassified Mucilaginibacter TaxID=2617802 RepID=UPI002AC8E9CC|nr:MULTISPECIES: TolC family protein [unclassified Mucilaginibacter]MEB0261626.1 TolC family protein [Mucilaginibacter sp. 10I4]MEB0278490.1 TolC family protein [Mucilaginibacter sp. 10B2]MEB0300710.1 TolC family protein [Mucilaginibacter sp. 5C4]WPX23553.1 TolC family protein [Mucilaginibacter sp. 5C4]